MDGLVGLFLGTTILGQYKIVWRIYDMLMQLAITPVSSVAFAAFPKFMHNPSELRKLYHNMLSISLILYLPAFSGIAYTAKDWVPIVLGEKWQEIIPLMHVTVLASVVTVYIFFQNALLLSYRKNRFLFKQNILKVLLIAGVTFITAHYDIRLVILGFSAVYLGLVLWNTELLHRIHRWKRLDDLASLVPALFCTTMMILTLFSFDHFVSLKVQGLRLAVDAVLGAAMYALSFFIFFPVRTFAMLGFLKNLKTLKDQAV